MTQVSVEAFMLKDLSVLEKKKEIKFPQFDFPFILRSLTAAEFQSVKKGATRPVKQNGITTSKLNEDLFTDLLTTAAMVQPNLNNADLQEFYGTMSKPADTLRAMLTAGQWGEILTEVNELSGFNEEESIDELVEDVKK